MTSESARFVPFSDDATVLSVGNLSLENRADRITIHGDVDLTRDQQGLALALQLKACIDQICSTMQASPLPEAQAVVPTTAVSNPFKNG